MVDASQFQDLLNRARTVGDPRARAALLAEALGLWRGGAFADFGDQLFTQAAIGRLEEERLVALEEQAEARLALGDHAQLASELAGLVSRHPLRERLRAAQLTALYRAGRPSEALDSYRELRKRLADELGLDPGAELAALHQAILVADPALRAPVPAPTAAPRTNLPGPFGSLIGRTEAVTTVRTLLASSRLVTLTGPGGVGKTRLAVETAAQQAGLFPDGTWLVELAAEAGEADVAELTSAALGLRDSAPPGPLADWLAAALESRQMLLVLDNCEHLIGPAAALADRLLRAAPGLRILATSQEPLAIDGEQLWEVPPLELPGPEDGEATVVARAGAVRLFVARAAAAAPGFTLDGDNARAVAAICRRLDGIPLALELAAARVRALGVHTLATRLDDRFRLLTAGKRGAPARQQTLRAVIDWSWELASEPEQIVLRRLAVHADGCTLTAAEQTCAGDGLDRADVAGLLARLVDRSLVAVTAEGAREPRYRLFESVAAYGTERLREAGELDRFQRGHRQFYAALAEQARPQLRGDSQRQWLQRLDRESANIRSALDGAIRHREADLALRLAGAMTWYWFLRGRLTEARRALESALAAALDSTRARLGLRDGVAGRHHAAGGRSGRECRRGPEAARRPRRPGRAGRSRMVPRFRHIRLRRPVPQRGPDQPGAHRISGRWRPVGNRRGAQHARQARGGPGRSRRGPRPRPAEPGAVPRARGPLGPAAGHRMAGLTMRDRRRLRAGAAAARRGAADGHGAGPVAAGRRPADLARPDRDADRRLCAGARTPRGGEAARRRAGL